MGRPVTAQKGPYVVKLEPGDHYWCACGRSARQPFCDGLHKGTEFSPKRITVTEAATFSLCGCKHSARKPRCDGTHRRVG